MPDVVTMHEVVDAAIRPVIAEHKVPGMAVAVTVDGQAYFFNYGVASRGTNEPVSEATIFELGSVSKTFTATLALYAQALGKLSLIDHPSKYMAQLKGSAVDKATLLNLGTYTAGGLPLQFPDEVSGDEGMVGYFQNWKPDAEPAHSANIPTLASGSSDAPPASHCNAISPTRSKQSFCPSSA